MRASIKAVPPETPTLTAVIHEVKRGIQGVVRNDLNLARIELRETTGQLKGEVFRLLVSGMAMALGTLPVMAFLVIGLGALMGGLYWLSALLVGVLFIGGGGAIAYRSYGRLKEKDFSFPRTRKTLDEEIAAVDRKLRALSRFAQHEEHGGGRKAA
jgi:uncharacterized membrane protein YqjE